jgi:hypothetical protein
LFVNSTVYGDFNGSSPVKTASRNDRGNRQLGR